MCIKYTSGLTEKIKGFIIKEEEKIPRHREINEKLANAILKKWGYKMKIAYPVIFTEVNTNILIEIPDLGILTESNDEGKEKGTLADAIAMARDAIGITCISLEDEGKTVVEPSAISDIDVLRGTFSEEGIGIVSLVDVDLSVYRRRMEQKTVRRNVTLPNWLNLEAEKAQVNVSRVLQEALMAKLGISK